MYAPPARHGIHVPEPVVTASLWLLAVVVALVAWGLLTTASIRTDDSYLTRDAPALAPLDPDSFDTLAYTRSGDFADQIWLRPVDGDGEGKLLATIPHIFGAGVLYGANVQGVASPRGDAIAVLSVRDAAEPRPGASLTIVGVPGGEMRTGFGQFDPASPLAWSPDGHRLALVRSEPPDDTGRRTSSVIEVDLTTGDETVVATFSGVFAEGVAPVGYSVDAERLYIVTVDNGGSNLVVERDGEVSPVGLISGGRTRDWSLSSDATRLAYIEVLSTSDRSYAGRVFHIGVAAPTVLERSTVMQLGVAWRPGSPMPDFGSLAGETWVIEPPPESPVFVWPLGWSPNGEALITSLHNVEDGRVRPQGVLELVVSDRRVLLEDGARFLGFVRGQ